jgi:DNA-binding MarR family transcriptional regulator
MSATTDRSAVARRAVDALLLSSRALVGVAARSLEELPADTTLPQFRALVLLSSRGTMPTGLLAEAMQVHPSTATRLVDRLHTKGLVRRGAVDGDRRQITVALTRRGRLLVERVTEARRLVLAAIVERLSRQDRALIEDAMVRFASAAGEVGDLSWELGWTDA